MEKYELGLNKKSFPLYFHGGEIWWEPLDSLYNQKELLKQKFKQDLVLISKPSSSSFIAVNLDQSEVDQETLKLIIDSFVMLGKPLRKVVFIGLTSKMRSYIKKRNTETVFIMTCLDDYEKAKEWLI